MLHDLSPMRDPFPPQPSAAEHGRAVEEPPRALDRSCEIKVASLGSGYLDSLCLCFLRLRDRERQQAITHLSPNFGRIDLIRQRESSMKVADIVLRIDRGHAGVFLEVDPSIDRQDP